MGRVHARTRAGIAAAAIAGLVVALLVTLSGGDAGAKVKKKKSGLTMRTQTFQMTQADEKQRFTVLCPKGKFPFGGGMFNTTPIGSDAEGIYPHSYERLGVQHGWHVSAVFLPGQTSAGGGQKPVTPRSVTLQVLCGPQLHFRSEHTTINVNPGEVLSADATCKGKRKLIGGGFQRTDFTSKGGDFVTAMHQTGPKTWHVVGSAYGTFGGELTAIAYCVTAKKSPISTVSASPISTVSASVPIDPKQIGTATTPPCPSGRKLAFGGFSTSPQDAVFFTDGRMNSNGSWSATGFNNKGPAAILTAYGYCIKL